MSWKNAGKLGLVALAVGLLLGVVPSASAHPLAAPAGPAAVSAPPVAAVSVHYTIPLGKEPSGLAYDPTNFDVYIPNQGSNNVTVISSVSHTHSSIPVGKSPYAETFDPYNGQLYVLNYNSSNVSIISASTNKVVANPSLGAHAKPVEAFFDPASGDVLVVNSTVSLGTGVGWLIVNSTNAVKKLTFGLGTILSIAYNPKSKDFYLPNFLAGTVSAITGSGSVSTITVGGYPEYVYVNPANNDTYAYNTNTGTHGIKISVISSANKVVTNITVKTITGGFMNPSGYDPATKTSYFAGYNYTTNKSYLLEISSANKVSATVSLGSGEYYLAFYDPANGDVYVTAFDQSIKVVSGTTVTKSLAVSPTTDVLIYDPTLKDMVGANDVNLTTTSTLYLINSTNGMSSLKVGKQAVAAFYDPKDTYIYVVNIGSKNVELVG